MDDFKLGTLSEAMGQTTGVFDTTRYTAELGYGLVGAPPETVARSMSIVGN